MRMVAPLSARCCHRRNARPWPRSFCEQRRVSQHRCHGAARLRPRRVQVFCLSPAAAGCCAARSALCAAVSHRQPLERAARYPSAVSGEARGLPRALPRAGQSKPTPLLLQYGPGDYNCLHQDLYGEHVFPCRSPSCCPAGAGFHRRRIRPYRAAPPHAVACRGGAAPPGRGRDLSRSPPARRGTRGVYRVNMRHGVSRLRSGQRHTLGIIFHDAK